MKPNLKTKHPFSKELFTVKMGKAEIKVYKTVYLGQAILKLSKMLEDFHKDIAKDVEIKFDTSRHSKDDNRPLAIVTNKKVIGMRKHEVSRKIMTEFAVIRTLIYSYRKVARIKRKTLQRCKEVCSCRKSYICCLQHLLVSRQNVVPKDNCLRIRITTFTR